MDNIGYSLLNPTGSLNFELATQQEANDEEDDAAEEERIKQKELQDLLTNAFDDLIDDEDDENDEEDRSSFIHDQNSQFSDNLSHDSGHWNGQRNSENENVSEGRTNERTVKFCAQKVDFIENSEVSRDVSQQSTGSDKGNDKWEHRYYVDEWIDDEHENERSHAESNKSESQKDVFAYRPFDLDINGSNAVRYKRTKTDSVELSTANGPTNGEFEVQQLRILYDARGREVDRLQDELDVIKDKAAKDIRILKRYFNRMKTEKEGCEAKLGETLNILNVANQEMSRMEGESRALEMQLKSVSENRDEQLQKLQSAESTIENLHAQLKELSKSENMVRAREQHITILNGIKDKHNNEVYSYRVEIDELKESLSNKNEELENFKQQLVRFTKECEDIRLDKAETVNRLIKALEESQNECQRLVKSGSKESNAKNSDVVMSLQEQLKETKRELELYVKAAELHILNGKTEQSKSSLPQPSLKNQDGLVGSLKGEIERALACLQNKNEQLQKLNTNHQAALSRIKLLEEKSRFAEQELKRSQATVQELRKDYESVKANTDFKEQMESLKKEKQALEEELRKKNQHLKGLSASKDELSGLVERLKEEMSNLAAQYENESQKAVEACRDACLRLHEDAMKGKKEEFSEQMRKVQHEYTLEVNKLTKDLDEVKSVYVKVCQEKERLEENLLSKWNVEKTKEIELLTSEWKKTKENEVLSLKERLRNTNNALSEEKKQKANYDKLLAERIKQMKQVWEKEQELVIQEKVLLKVKEELQHFVANQSRETNDDAIEKYIEQIQKLEERVKQSEYDFKKQLASLKTEAELEKVKAIAETAMQKDKHYQEKLKLLSIKHDKEKEEIVVETEARVAAELEPFLAEQKERFITALKSMQESHAKEKVDILDQYEEKLAKVTEDYEKLLNTQNENRDKENELKTTNTNEREQILRSNLAELEEKMKTKEREKVEVVNELQKRLKSKIVELEEAKANFDRQLMTIRQDKENTFARTMRSEATSLNERISKAERDTMDWKTKCEAEQTTNVEVMSKYKALKEKVKKYHRYIHGKEKEFAETLARLMQENIQVPEKIVMMKSEVIHILDTRLLELQKRFFSESSPIVTSSSYKATNRNGNVQPNAEHLKLQFAESIQKIHSDVLLFLEDCSNKATVKIQEEVATATWLLAERLDLTKAAKVALKKDSIDEMKTLPPTSVAPERITPLASRSSTPTAMTNGTSGHGTMADNPSSHPESAEIFRSVMVRTLENKQSSSSTNWANVDDETKSKPLKYWSSTPFNPDPINRVDLNAKERPTLGFTTDYSLMPSFVPPNSTRVKIVEPILVSSSEKSSPTSSLRSFNFPSESLSTGTWYTKGFSTTHNDVPEKLPSVTSKHLVSEKETSVASFAPLTPVFDTSSETRMELFKTFASELSKMKSEFWQSIENTKKTEAALLARSSSSNHLQSN